MKFFLGWIVKVGDLVMYVFGGGSNVHHGKLGLVVRSRIDKHSRERYDIYWPAEGGNSGGWFKNDGDLEVISEDA